MHPLDVSPGLRPFRALVATVCATTLLSCVFPPRTKGPQETAMPARKKLSLTLDDKLAVQVGDASGA